MRAIPRRFGLAAEGEVGDERAEQRHANLCMTSHTEKYVYRSKLPVRVSGILSGLSGRATPAFLSARCNAATSP